MAKKDIRDDKDGPDDGTAQHRERIGKMAERKQVIEEYIESLREIAESIRRKLN